MIVIYFSFPINILPKSLYQLYFCVANHSYQLFGLGWVGQGWGVLLLVLPGITL